jgi:hypothetical protein
MKRKLKGYPILIGIAGLFLLILFMVYWNHHLEKGNVTSAYVKTTEMKRKKNVTVSTAAEAVYYLIDAAQCEDADRAMRVFPIKTMTTSVDMAALLQESSSFSIDTVIAPASEHDLYYAIAYAELRALYANRLTAFLELMQPLQNASLEKITYQKADEEREAELLELANRIGAKEVCEMAAYFSDEDGYYKIPFVTVLFEKQWRVLEPGTVCETVSRQEVNEEATESEEEQEKRAALETISEKTRKKIASHAALLTLNYTCANAFYAETPQLLMKSFLKYVQLDKVGTLLSFGNTDDTERELKHTTLADQAKQGAFAERLKYFYYGFQLQWDTDEERTWQELGMNAGTLLASLKPDYFFYLSMVKMIPVSEDEYLIYFKYEGSYYRYTFCFTESDQGWQIRDIKDMVLLDEEAYNQEVS